MNNAHIVTDLGFGDSGKGCITDRIAATRKDRYDCIVIRYTGGSQAGHTVDLNNPGESLPQLRHVHSSFAAGTLGGFKSHMSRFCPIYPQNLVREAHTLLTKVNGFNKSLCSVDPLAPLITVYDVAWNRVTQVGTNTCGLGIGATMDRMLNSEAQTFMADLTHRQVLGHKLLRVFTYYMAMIGNDVGLAQAFEREIDRETIFPEEALEFVHLRSTEELIDRHHTVIFEGAQGIMLDQDHGFQPHVTWGDTTSRNAVDLIKRTAERVFVTVHHVTRAYQTRHGDGPMTSEDYLPIQTDLTNVWNKYQGDFKTRRLDADLLQYASLVDRAYLCQLPSSVLHFNQQLHVTCCDHLSEEELLTANGEIHKRLQYPIVNYWHGPTRDQPLNGKPWSL